MSPDRDLHAVVADMTAALQRAVHQVDELVGQTFTAEVADGAVAATVTGARQLIEVRIRPAARREIDNLTLGELVVDAIGKAEQLADEARSARLAEVSVGPVNLAAFLADPTGQIPGLPFSARRGEARS